MSGTHDLFARFAVSSGCFRFTSVEFTLASGRKFRYQLRDYPFSAFASDAELDAICCRLIKDKYRYCEWDRAHPKTNSEAEIYDAILKWMKQKVANAKEVKAELDSSDA